MAIAVAFDEPDQLAFPATAQQQYHTHGFSSPLWTWFIENPRPADTIPKRREP
jgi:hypothetical protein